jgi:hypothetical protein
MKYGTVPYPELPTWGYLTSKTYFSARARRLKVGIRNTVLWYHIDLVPP